MKILLVAATSFELENILKRSKILSHKIESIVTGVGIAATAFALGKHLAYNRYDLAINVGLAGSFDKSIALGEVVEVIEDQFAEELIEDGDELLSYQSVGLRQANDAPFQNGLLHPTYFVPHSFTFSTISSLRQVNAITVNTVHGNTASIQAISERLDAQAESMEGAAFFYACRMEKIPCLQLRAISNYVEKRNRAAWKIDLALNNLADTIYSFLNQL